MIKTYRCKETFLVDNYDGDGFYLDTASWIEEGALLYEMLNTAQKSLNL